MDGHKHDEVCLAVRDEDPKTKKEDRELDNKDLNSVYHDGSFEPLVTRSIGFQAMFRGGCSYIDCSREGTQS